MDTATSQAPTAVYRCTNCDAKLTEQPGDGDLLGRLTHPDPCIRWAQRMRGCYSASA